MNSAVRQVFYYLKSASFMTFSLLEPGISEFFASSEPISKLTTSNPAKRTNMMATKMVTVGSGSLPFAYLSVLCVRPSLRYPAIVLPRYPARPWPENRRSPGRPRRREVILSALISFLQKQCGFQFTESAKVRDECRRIRNSFCAW